MNFDRVNCGSHDATSCADCVEGDSSKGCSGDCSWQGSCIKKQVLPRRSKAEVQTVNCGHHRAADCSACPQGHGAEWCNGDCMWHQNACVLKSNAPRSVSCGAHTAPDCSKCPQGNGEQWCHGECTWKNGTCESVATGFELQSNTVVVMTSYGNEYKVFAAKGHIPGGQADRGRSFEWAFVDDRRSDQVIDAAKEKKGLEITNGGSVYKVDPVAMLKDPLYRAEAQLAHMDANGAGENRYAVLTRIYPILRHRDMHMIRRLRRMCVAADEQGTGVIRTHIFHGLLSWVCIRLTREEANQLQALFGCDETGQLTEESRDLINYHRFLRLMGASMSNFRLEAVKDAWKKLEDSAIAAMVDITHLQRLFRAEAFPKAQDGSMSPDEAREEFLRQWELDHPEGRITWDAFKQYYEDVSLAVEDDELFVELALPRVVVSVPMGFAMILRLLGQEDFEKQEL
eukprot:s797_g23.t3